ncbi:MAG: hypothetical protein FJ279_06095 [Planctomycetes bacterium]|nr:hypothetical protein [Planctomycetota bacterium]MBM4079473.1 hypothetical protein [Planctomycetota bacterium]
MALPEDDPRLTPLSELFVYHIFGLPKELKRWQKNIGAYQLRVTGLVERPTRLTLSQVRDEFKPVSADMVLQCMTNVHWGRIHFTGPRLLDVLEQAGIRKEARKIALRGAEGFDTDLRLEDIRQRPDAFLLAYAMNDAPLTADHGFPLRVTADGKYGYKWCKWLVEVEVVDYDYKGHYEDKRRWSDAATRGQPVT